LLRFFVSLEGFCYCLSSLTPDTDFQFLSQFSYTFFAFSLLWGIPSKSEHPSITTSSQLKWRIFIFFFLLTTNLLTLFFPPLRLSFHGEHSMTITRQGVMSPSPPPPRFFRHLDPSCRQWPFPSFFVLTLGNEF